MDTSLQDKTAIVCGSSQGIGRAAAVAIAELGANVILLARNAERLQSVLAELPATNGQQHDILVADFASPEEVESSIHGFIGSGKTAHVLINNTGGPPGGAALDADVHQFRQAFNNHLVCNHLLVQALVPGMKAAKYGRVVNVISTSVKQPIPGLGVSNTIRGAVASWAKTLANELGGFGITVNNVLPGFTSTARLASIISTKAEKQDVETQAIEQQMMSTIPAGRFADPSEIAAAVAFLASPAAGYINGINLPVDGGRTSCL